MYQAVLYMFHQGCAEYVRSPDLIMACHHYSRCSQAPKLSDNPSLLAAVRAHLRHALRANLLHALLATLHRRAEQILSTLVNTVARFTFNTLYSTASTATLHQKALQICAGKLL